MVYYISANSPTTPMGQIISPKSDTTKSVELATKTQVETVKPCNDAVKLETSAKSSVETKSIDFVDNKKVYTDSKDEIKNRAIGVTGLAISSIGGGYLIATAKTNVTKMVAGIAFIVAGSYLFASQVLSDENPKSSK